MPMMRAQLENRSLPIFRLQRVAARRADLAPRLFCVRLPRRHGALLRATL